MQCKYTVQKVHVLLESGGQILGHNYIITLHTYSYSFYTVQLLYTVKEKGGNPERYHTPSLWFKEIRTETSSPSL